MEYIAEPLRPLALPIEDLQPDAANVRLHNERNIETIKASLKQFGQRLPLVVQEDGMIVRAGNGRLQAAKELGWTHIAAVVVDESSVEATAFAIADNRTAELAEWDAENLAALIADIPEDLIGAVGFNEDELSELLKEAEEEDAVGDQYTRKVEIPIYEPEGEKPDVKELTDLKTFKELKDQIDAADLPDEVADFLRMAAARHIVFDYQTIANYYAHAEPEVQALMERSALVIVDVDQAIEHGFLKLNERFEEAFRKDYPDA